MSDEPNAGGTNARDGEEEAQTDNSRDGAAMVRTHVRMPPELVDRVDSAVEAGRFHNRSAAVRAAVREKFVRAQA